MPPTQAADEEEVPPTQDTLLGTDALTATLRGGDALEDVALTAAPTQDTVVGTAGKDGTAAPKSSNTAESVALADAPTQDTVVGTAGEGAAPTQDTVMGTAEEEDAKVSQAQAPQGTASCCRQS